MRLEKLFDPPTLVIRESHVSNCGEKIVLGRIQRGIKSRVREMNDLKKKKVGDYIVHFSIQLRGSLSL